MLPPSQRTDSSWALLRQEGAWEVSGTQEPVASKRLSAQPRRMRAALEQGKGRDSSPTDPPNPAFVTVPSFPTPMHRLASLQAPRIFPEGGSHLMSILWVYYTSIKMFFKFLGTEGASEAWSALLHPQDSEARCWLGQSPSLRLCHPGLL